MTLGSDPGADPYVPGHGDTGFDAVHYELELDYDVAGNRLTGRARIDCIARESLDELSFDLHHLDVAKVSLDGRSTKHRAKRDKVLIRPPQDITTGQRFTVALRYAGHPRPVRARRLGSAGWEELTDGAIVAAQPHGAPSWFPCNDRPSNKATYRVSLTAPAGYRVVANGRLVRTRRRSGSVTWTYEQVEPMATYLAAAHVGRYELRATDGPVPTAAVLPRRLLRRYAETFARQAEMMTAFVGMFGPYPFEGYTVVITDDDLEIPLEAQGLATFGENSLSSSWDAERLVAHELAHQWFGNSLTLGRWKDIWLHEGFACYAEWLWSEQSGRASAHVHAATHHARLTTLGQDLILSDPGPELMFDDRVYKRGALLLHALRLTLGDERFFGVLRDWTRTRAYSTVSTDDFMELASTQTPTDLTDLFDAWLNRAALPHLPPGP